MLPGTTARPSLRPHYRPACRARRRTEPVYDGVNCGDRIGSKHDSNPGTAMSLQRFKVAGRLGLRQCAE